MKRTAAPRIFCSLTQSIITNYDIRFLSFMLLQG